MNLSELKPSTIDSISPTVLRGLPLDGIYLITSGAGHWPVRVGRWRDDCLSNVGQGGLPSREGGPNGTIEEWLSSLIDRLHGATSSSSPSPSR